MTIEELPGDVAEAEEPAPYAHPNFIRVEVVCDSIVDGVRLTTLRTRYPEIIHNEVLRHRVVSHSVESSRAVPLNKAIQSVREEPYIPFKWGAKQKGMHADDVVPAFAQHEAAKLWLEQRDQAIQAALRLDSLGVHKENGSQLLKPFIYIDDLWSSTDWTNFFNLRTPVQAREEIRTLSRAIRHAMEASTPKKRNYHLPFIEDGEVQECVRKRAVLRAELRSSPLLRKESLALRKGYLLDMPLVMLCLVSAARAARTSFGNTGQTRPLAEDLLKGVEHASNGHSSVLEHAAFIDDAIEEATETLPPSNFRPPWLQFRKIFLNERVYGGGDP